MESKRYLLMAMAMFMTAICTYAKSIPTWWSVSPADGSTVKELSVIKIDNGSYSDTFRAEEGSVLYIDGSATAYTVSYETRFGYPDDTIVMTLANPMTSDGEHIIYVPAGFFTYMYYGEDLRTSEMFEWTVKVENGGGEVIPDFKTNIPNGFKVSPKDGETVTSIKDLTISDAFYEYESFKASSSEVNVKINGNEMAATTSATDTSVTFTLAEEITEPGTYNIEVPEGAFTCEDFFWDTVRSETFRWSVTVEAGEEPEDPQEPEATTIPAGFKVTPEDGTNVEELSVITVTNSVLGEMEFVEGSVLYINGSPAGFTASVDYFEETLTLTLAEAITEEGAYSIFLPKGFFTYYGDLTSEDFKWTVNVTNETGVMSITATDTKAEIYTTDGVRVKEMLPGRIYIVKSGNSVFKMTGQK